MRRRTTASEGTPTLLADGCHLAACLLVLFAVALLVVDGGSVYGQFTKSGQKPASKPNENPSLNSDSSSTNATQPTGSSAASEEAEDKTSLPPGFSPPPASRQPLMLLEKPLITAAEIEEFRGKMSDFGRIMRNGTTTASASEIIKQGIDVRLREMTLVSNQLQLSDLVSRFMRKLNSAGQLEKNRQRKRQFRSFVFSQVTDSAGQLLDNNYYVRFHAVLILSRLTLVEGDRNKRISEVAYTDATDVLLDVAKDPEQPDEIKIHAVRGIKRILQLGEPSTTLRSTIADVLIVELDRKSAHPWYQRILVDTIPWVGLYLDRNSLPFIVRKLEEIIVDRDKQRTWSVRCAAAKAVGRAELSGQINVSLLAYEIASLEKELTDAVNKDPESVVWNWCFWDLYLAFVPEDEFETQEGVGLKNRLNQANLSIHKPAVDGAYAHVIPLLKYRINSEFPTEFPPELVAPLSEWINENAPNSMKLHPLLDEITKEVTKRNGSDEDPKTAG